MLTTIVMLLATTTIATTTPIPPLKVEAKVEESVKISKVELTPLEENFLKKLEQCESGGSTTIKVIDTNGLYSFGRYQFQEKTFLEYGKRYNLIASTTQKAEPLIFDGDLQKEIAIRMLRAGEQNHWYNCSQKIGKFPLKAE